LGSPRCPAVRLQTAPTTPAKATTTTAPYGCYEPAFNLPSLVEAAGASYVARWTTYHVRQLARSMAEMLTKRGFGFIGKFADRDRPDYLELMRGQMLEQLKDRYVGAEHLR